MPLVKNIPLLSKYKNTIFNKLTKNSKYNLLLKQSVKKNHRLLYIKKNKHIS